MLRSATRAARHYDTSRSSGPERSERLARAAFLSAAVILTSGSMASVTRPKALYLSHGGGPGFFMKGVSGPFSQMNAESPAAEWYRTFTKDWPKPSAIVVVSAHWEEKNTVRVTTGVRHPLLYDYCGFPEYTYNLGYECPGHPELAGRIVEMLRAGGIKAEGDESRGYDHGVFVPLKLMYPEADIPVVQVSLLAGLSAEQHLKIGTALAGLLEEGEDILVVGSGQATHNMRSFAGEYPPGVAAPQELQFVTWLKETATDAAVSPEERRRRLAKWASEAPHGRLSHPREEHLLPLHVVAGCTGFSPGVTIYDGWVLGAMSLACVGYWGPGAASDGAAGGSGTGSGGIDRTLGEL